MSEWMAFFQVIIGLSLAAAGMYRGLVLGEFVGAIAFVLGMVFVDVTMLRFGRGKNE